MPSVSFVIPTFHRPDALETTLATLLNVLDPGVPAEIVVVDNADDDATARVVRGLAERAENLRYEVCPRPGSAATRNHGARAAQGELLIFCDDDILVEPSHVELHLRTRQRFGESLLSGTWEFAPGTRQALQQTPFGRYRLELDRRFRSEVDDESLGEDCFAAEALTAANLSISREAFWRLGGFDEEFPYAGAEDREFSTRAAEAGYPLVRSERIRVLHNDQTITFRQFCIREERSAQTVGVLSARYPDSKHATQFTAVNSSLSRSDPPFMALKKIVKTVLSLPPILAMLHRVIEACERRGVNDSVMTRLYTTVVGVHIFRGFRHTAPGQ